MSDGSSDTIGLSNSALRIYPPSLVIELYESSLAL